MAVNNVATLTVNPPGKPDGLLPRDMGPLDEPKSSRTTDVWTSYLTHADELDKARVENWKGDMDGILIFSGLFSAVTTAFIVETYKNLQPDNEQMSTELLVRVVASLENAPNITAVGITPYGGPSSTISLWINALWFLSLLLSIICAIAATLIQQWSRIYLQRWSSARLQPGLKGRPDFLDRAHLRARAHAYFANGVDTFRLVFVVNCVPFVLHLALFLFVAGLVIFAFTINKALAWLALAVAIILALAYATVTILPAIAPSCPYRTPLSHVIQITVDAFKSPVDDPPDDNVQPHSSSSPGNDPPKDRSHAAMLKGVLAKLNLDTSIISRTMGIWVADGDLTDENLEAVFRALPGVVHPVQQEQSEESAKVVNALVFEKAPIALELPRLLRSCARQLHLPELTSKTINRAKTCLNLLGLLAKLVGKGHMDVKRTQEIADKCIYPALEDTKALFEYKTGEGQSSPWQREVSCTTMLLLGLVFRSYHTILKNVFDRTQMPSSVHFPDGFHLDVRELFRIRDRLRVILPAYISQRLVNVMDIYIPPDNPLFVLQADIEAHDRATFPNIGELKAFVSAELRRVKDAYRVFQLTVDMTRVFLEELRLEDPWKEEKEAFDALLVPVDWAEAGDLDNESRIRVVVSDMLISEHSMSVLKGSPQGKNDIGNVFTGNHDLVNKVVVRSKDLFRTPSRGISVRGLQISAGSQMSV